MYTTYTLAAQNTSGQGSYDLPPDVDTTSNDVGSVDTHALAPRVSTLAKANHCLLPADHVGSVDTLPLLSPSLAPELYEYQKKGLNRLRVACTQHRLVLLEAPTGSGKTILAAEMMRSAVSKGKCVLFLADRKELIEQASTRLDQFGLDHGIIKAGNDRVRPNQPIQVASVQTLVNREMPKADLVIIDETHHATASTYQTIIDAYPKARIIGLTATPERADGKGLGDIFAELVELASFDELIAHQPPILVRPRVFAPFRPDLARIRTIADDYDKKQIAGVMDRPQIIGDVIEHWLKLAQGRKTVLFATSVQHSKNLRDAFLAAGVRAEHLDGKTPDAKREQILAALAAGDIDVVCNVGVLTEGWDLPSASCVILARPTQSLGLYLQMVGRILRATPGKDTAIILDHAGCCFLHGLPTEPRQWSLHAQKRRQDDKKAPGIKNCPKCYAVAETGTAICIECDYAWPPAPERAAPEQKDGNLVEFTGRPQPNHWLARFFPMNPKRPTWQEKERLYDFLVNVQQKKGHRKGWIAHQYKDVMGKWPRGLDGGHLA